MKKYVMLDLETLSTRPDAAVISAGIAVFDDYQIINTAGWCLKMDLVTGHIDPGTVKWWSQQSEAARRFSFDGMCTPLVMARELEGHIVNADELWANDPDFDVVILKSWWERHVDKMFPVSHRSLRSMRTIRALAGMLDIKYNALGVTGVAHNPIDDAACQAREVIALRSAMLKLKRERV